MKNLILGLGGIMILCSSAVAAMDEQGLVADYTFGEGSGPALKDKSGNKNDGRIVGAVWVKGERGAALDFGGVADQVDCQDELVTRLRGPMTVLAWVRSNSRAPQNLVSRGDWQLALASGGVPIFSTQPAAGGKWAELTPVRAAQAVPPDQWVMIAGVYDTDRQVMEVYTNGTLSASVPKTDGSIGGIFRSKLLLGNRLDGLMGETRLYSRALSADEIREIYRTTCPADSIKIPTCRLRLTPHLFYRERKLHAQLNLRNPNPKGGIRVQVALFCAGGKTPLAEGIVDDLVAASGKVHEFDLSGLKPGEYEVRAKAVSVTDSSLLAEVVRPFTLPEKPQWYDSKAGLTDKVLPPWTPLRVRIDDPADPQMPAAQVNVSSWGRIYTFGSHPLPEQIRTADRAILAEPVRLSARVDGRNVKWAADFPLVDKETDSKVVLSMKASDPALTLTTQATIEFDGLMRFDCTIRPAKKVCLENLALEIPLRREHAQLVYYYRDKLYQGPGSLPAAGVVRCFNPAIWLGNEECGLQWFTGSDQNWYVADANRAIEIVPEGDKVVLRLNLVTKPTTLEPGVRQTMTTAPELTYTFGLQATPVKPVTEDALDQRIAGTPWYGEDYGLMTREIEGKKGLDYFAEKGVRQLLLSNSWSDWFAYPKCVGHEEKLHRFVKECHARGIRVTVYMGSLLVEAAPEFPAFVDDLCFGGGTYYVSTPPGRTYNVYTPCIASDWQDLIADGGARLLEKYDLDGFYFDGVILPGPCNNVHHGCGYIRPDGTVGEAYPFWRAIQAARRMYCLVKSHNPGGRIDLHPASFWLSPVMAYCTTAWDGETILGFTAGHVPTERKKLHLTEYLPLDLFRAQFMGKAWGVATEFLDYYVPVPYEKQMALTMLHDTPVRPYNNLEAVQFISKVWRTCDEFDRKGAEWLPYWKNSEYVSVEPKNAYVSLYRHPKNGVLAVVSNLAKEKAQVNVVFALNKLGLSEKSTAINALTGEPISIEKGKIALDLDSVDWRLVWVKP